MDYTSNIHILHPSSPPALQTVSVTLEAVVNDGFAETFAARLLEDVLFLLLLGVTHAVRSGVAPGTLTWVWREKTEMEDTKNDEGMDGWME